MIEDEIKGLRAKIKALQTDNEILCQRIAMSEPQVWMENRRLNELVAELQKRGTELINHRRSAVQFWVGYNQRLPHPQKFVQVQLVGTRWNLAVIDSDVSSPPDMMLMDEWDEGGEWFEGQDAALARADEVLKTTRG